MGGKLHISRKNMMVVITVLVILLAVIIPVYAWYTATKRVSLTDSLEVDMPPTIYIKDDTLQEITTFNLDGMTIGEDYNKVFCVSPAVVDTVNSFFLGVIYSENLGIDINIYPVSGVTDTEPTEGTLHESSVIGNAYYYFEYRKEKDENSGNIADIYDFKKTYGDWVTETEPDSKLLNNGIFKSYIGNRFSASKSTDSSSLIEKLNDTGRYRFFVLSVTWPENIDYNVDANAKEADIVYIVAKGTMNQNQ